MQRQELRLVELGGTSRNIYNKFFIGSSLFFCMFEAVYFYFCKPPFDGMKEVIGRDFVNMWMGARIAVTGRLQNIFDVELYNQALHQIFSANLLLHNWSYPPQIFLFIWPFAFMPYLMSYIVWTALGLTALWLASGGCGASRKHIIFIALAPVTFLNIAAGQNGFFTAALLIGALTNWDKRPVAAGILFGFLSVKPQLVLLVPFVLILTQRWRVFAYFIATFALLCAITTVIWGVDVWRSYIELAVPTQNWVMIHATGMMQAMMPTPYMNVRVMGFSILSAWFVQIILSFVSIIAVFWTFRIRRDPTFSAAMLLAASLIFTPYAFNYDMMALTMVLAKLHERTDNYASDTRLILALWVTPVLMMPVGVFGHIAVPTLLLLALVYRLYQRMKEQEELQSLKVFSSEAATLSTI